MTFLCRNNDFTSNQINAGQYAKCSIPLIFGVPYDGGCSPGGGMQIIGRIPDCLNAGFLVVRQINVTQWLYSSFTKMYSIC